MNGIRQIGYVINGKRKAACWVAATRKNRKADRIHSLQHARRQMGRRMMQQKNGMNRS